MKGTSAEGHRFAMVGLIEMVAAKLALGLKSTIKNYQATITI
jgi:hypothetical protein